MKVALFFLFTKLFLVLSVHSSSPDTHFHDPCLPEEEILHIYPCEEKPSSIQKPAAAVPTITRMKDDDYCIAPQSSLVSEINEAIPVIARSIVALTIAKLLVDRKMDNLYNTLSKYSATKDLPAKQKPSTPSKSNRQQ